MQINGFKEFSLQIDTLKSYKDSDKRNNISVQNYQTQNKNFDTASISELGKRLNIRSTQKTDKSNLTGKAGEVANLMSKSLSKFQEIFEKMYDLTQKASQDNLTSIERINSQIEMENLRNDLSEASWKLNEDFSMLSGHKPVKTLSEIANNELQLRSEKFNGDTRNVLERAKDRILNGEEWDIAENYIEFVSSSEDGELKVTDSKWMVSNDEEAITVSDKIKASGTINLMSSSTAKDGLKQIENEIMGVNHMRENFSSFLMDYTGDDLEKGLKVSELPTLEEQQGKFDSILGIMQEAYFNRDTGEFTPPELVHPNNKLAFMFQRIDRLFNKVSGNLAGNFISEDVETQTISEESKKYFQNF